MDAKFRLDANCMCCSCQIKHEASEVRRGHTGKGYAFFLLLKALPKPHNVLIRNKSTVIFLSLLPTLAACLIQRASVGQSFQTPWEKETSRRAIA